MACRKKVTYLPHHFRDPSGQGGLRTWHQVNRLTENADVTIIVPGVDTLSGERHSTLAKRQIWSVEHRGEALRVFRVNSLSNDRRIKWKRALYYSSFSIMQFLCGLRHGKAQAVLTTSMPVSSMLLAYVLAGMRRVPLILDVRDLPTDLAVEIGYFQDSIISRAIRRCENFVYRRADLVVTVSEGMRKLLLPKGVDPSKVHVVPIGFDQLENTSSIDSIPESIVERLRGKFVVLYSGTMGHVVDVDTVLNAAELTKNDRSIVYLLVGDGQRIDEYRERATNQNLDVIFTGRVEKQAVSAYCAMASVCLYPLIDGQVIAALLGNKIFDYMGAAKPTIYTGPCGDVGNLILTAKCGVTLAPRDASGLVESIKKLQANPALARSMGRAGSEYARSKATAQASAAQFADLIDGVIDA